ncbi:MULTISPECIES: TIGR01777 family oxidoreductase [unclassified Rathayibacter]|uniref:TIGR01777 family oxidoreductase n=1 Tax=unclassified Rathayibacter TaxID=2609250 RepID=UPI00188D30BD|nr:MULTISPECIES: TIGR01777 family oxidoreductase [unclassified Rathayibacter]MBF4463562.1 TIGR01777 family protein [Rathayibacter sp. VKM Ac-2879]MBF4504988.1 TIGR01777 family protein [Rathayibacter sp. VKM Ac-2878]
MSDSTARPSDLDGADASGESPRRAARALGQHALPDEKAGTAEQSPRLRVLVAGASGMIGSELCRQLRSDGHEVLRLVRHSPGSKDEFHWAPTSHMLDFSVLDRVDAVVNLSGASISRLPWTSSYKREILDSRVQATQTLTDAMRMASAPPSILVNASAVGYYGDRPGEELTEASPRGEGFLADVVERWEQTAHLAPEATRVVTVRTGLVLGNGGALKPLLPLTRLGLSGPLGGGRQSWPWISLYDEAAAIRHLLTSSIAGPVNLAGPQPATANEVMRTLAELLHRPFALPVPEKAIELLLRDAGHELLLSSQRLVPQRLIDDGFVFRHRTVAEALRWVLA